MRKQAEVKAVKDQYTETILSKPNVVGVGTGYKEVGGRTGRDLCVVALVSQKIPKAGLSPEELVPMDLDGVETDVIQVGVIRAALDRKARWRPAQGGISIGHYQVTAGTLGCVVRDRETGDRLILSNNHVLANSNDAEPGDPILQPGTADGGRIDDDHFAQLERFYPIRYNLGPSTCNWADRFVGLGNWTAKALGSKHRVQAFWNDPEADNVVDAALARPLDPSDLNSEILEIGTVTGTQEARLGMPVRKSGRSTGLTTASITVMDATINVYYGERIARFEDQLVTPQMSEPGDSGSLLVAGDSLSAVGLLFAGSDQATIHNPIQAVLDRLVVEL